MPGPGPLSKLFVILAVPATLLASAAAAQAPAIAPWLTGALVAPADRQAETAERLAGLQAFYERRQLRPAWTDGAGALTPAGRAALALLAGSERHGLPAERYALRAAEAGELDVRISWQLLRYARDLRGGRWPRRESMVLWRRPAAVGEPDLALLERAAHDPATVETLAPVHPQYAALREARARYARIAAAGGWATWPARGGAWPLGVVQRLAAEGDLREGMAPGAALKRWQQRYGVASTGRPDPATRAAWDVPVEERLRQVDLNLERWRWMPAELGARHVLVNVPTWELQAFRDRRRVLAMRIVGGAPATPTPVFSARASSVVFRPWWNVPASIAEGELMPLARRDPAALARRGILRTGGALRQRPGPSNALGLVKVTLDDTPGVYLHDTPADALFARPSRAFSHGCVRLQKPAELAALLLEGTGWDRARVAAAMARGPERAVALAQPWDVHVVYFTAWVDETGLRFAPDVYGHDALQARVLWGAPLPGERPTA